MAKSALSMVQKYHPEVTRVVEAKKALHVSVTPEDCKGSKSKNPSSCAMARACEREYDGAIISLSIAYVINGKTATRYKVPQSVAREIVSFDRNHDFRPGDYKLNAPTKDQVLGLHVNREYPGRVVPKYAKTKKRIHKTSGIRSLNS